MTRRERALLYAIALVGPFVAFLLGYWLGYLAWFGEPVWEWWLR